MLVAQAPAQVPSLVLAPAVAAGPRALPIHCEAAQAWPRTAGLEVVGRGPELARPMPLEESLHRPRGGIAARREGTVAA